MASRLAKKNMILSAGPVIVASESPMLMTIAIDPGPVVSGSVRG